MNRGSLQTSREVKKMLPNRKFLERTSIEGDRPVSEGKHSSYVCFPSSAGHVESRMNLGGPPSKAKYSQVTDSEQVP